jgi:hypothetical protein
MTKTQKQKRRSEIIKQLSDLSRNGWAGALECDYKPLEKELAELDA